MISEMRAADEMTQQAMLQAMREKQRADNLQAQLDRAELVLRAAQTWANDKREGGTMLWGKSDEQLLASIEHYEA